MTHICVAGGTGQVGRAVVRQALTLGHEVSVISRNPPASGSPGDDDGATYFRADVTTGNGLSAALAGAAVVIDCLEGKSGRALRNFADGGARLLRAAHAAGVRKAVLLSIINCDQVPLRFYRSKADKEDVYAGSPLETRHRAHDPVSQPAGAALRCRRQSRAHSGNQGRAIPDHRSG